MTKALKLYRPGVRFIIIDIVILLVNFLLITFWLKAVDTITAQSYPIYISFSILWMLFHYLFKHYKKNRIEKEYVSKSFNSIYASVIAATLNFFLFEYAFHHPVFIINYSIFVLGVLLLSLVHTTLYFAYLYALDIEEVAPIEIRPPASLVKEAYELDNDTLHTIESSIIKETNTRVLQYLSKVSNLKSSATKLISSGSIFNFEKLRTYRYDTIINLKRLNDIRGINVLFSKINEKLPDNGIFIGCFENSGVKKRDILKK
jgi:hypothetical protein